MTCNSDLPVDIEAEIQTMREALDALRAGVARSLSYALERLDAGDVAMAREVLCDAIALHAGRPPTATVN